MADKKKADRPKPTVRLSAEVAGAVFKAATSSTGYSTTTGSEHATKVRDGVVKVELPHDEKGRHTVVVKVPDSISFELTE